ncbi:glycosyl transferase [Bacillus sp. OxB-1]|uniref:glycosyltransferase n=1 Tax=Bacillus sp. (strain OxB-1) TaxID=98228 RepID=UPI000581EB28|nr:glycosyltransferase [Bacillus sp. OxB-1]BAQ12000.1 glycosyl transferase [Bacillus sp. OxB-1]
MQKKILFISDHGDLLAPLGSEQAGGQNNYVKQLAEALCEHGNQVDIITHWANPDDPQIEYFGGNCRVIRIAAGNRNYVSKNKMFGMLPQFYNEMKRLVPVESYDLIHTHYWLSGVIGLYMKKEFNLPWIHTNHSLGKAKELATGVAENTRLSAEKLILGSVDRIVATTESEKELIHSFVPEPAPTDIISIGVDPVFYPDETAALESAPYFAFAGRLEKTKGIYVLVDAFRKLVASHGVPSSTKLIIAGGDSTNVEASAKLPKKKTLRKAIAGLEHRIDFIGSQTQRQLSNLFNGAISTIVPSYYESFGMVAAESQACGCPVIASKVGGLQDVVKDRVTGIHVKKKDVVQLAESMESLLVNREYAEELGEKAFLHANQAFRWSTLSEKMDNLYEVILHEKQNAYAGDRSRWYVSG